jgi:hypothetical protein
MDEILDEKLEAIQEKDQQAFTKQAYNNINKPFNYSHSKNDINKIITNEMDLMEKCDIDAHTIANIKKICKFFF